MIGQASGRRIVAAAARHRQQCWCEGSRGGCARCAQGKTQADVEKEQEMMLMKKYGGLKPKKKLLQQVGRGGKVAQLETRASARAGSQAAGCGEDGGGAPISAGPAP